MDEAHRLFIAVDLPMEAKTLLNDLQTRLRQYTTVVRWADPRGTHLTLKFLGNVPALNVVAVVQELQIAVREHAPFELQTDALGMFPNSKRPRVVWLGLAGNLQALRRLHADVERYVAPLGFPSEERPFTPHLTLGRSPKAPTPAQLTSIAHAVAQTSVPQTVVIPVHEVVLMRSELLPGGARYTPIAYVPLDQGGG